MLDGRRFRLKWRATAKPSPEPLFLSAEVAKVGEGCLCFVGQILAPNVCVPLIASCGARTFYVEARADDGAIQFRPFVQLLAREDFVVVFVFL